MSPLPYEAYSDILESMAQRGAQYGYRTRTLMNTDDTWAGTWATDSLYALVFATQNPEMPVPTIDVIAGSVYRAKPDAALFQALCTSTGQIRHGGPWARVNDDGASYGWRTQISGALISEEGTRDAFSYVLSLIDNFGDVCNGLADAYMPRSGGTRILDGDPNAWPALLSGMME